MDKPVDDSEERFLPKIVIRYFLIGNIIASEHHRGEDSPYTYVMTKRNPATDVIITYLFILV
jgi:hypothetical protein